MSPLKRSNNIAARMGRWSARHWKTAVFGWLAFVVASFYIGNFLVGTKQINDADTNVGQAQKADRIIKAAGFADQNVQAEFVLVQSKTLTADAPAFRAVVNDVVRWWPGYWGAWLLSRLFSRNPLTRYDGPLSVRKAYTRGEMAELVARAGLRPVAWHGYLGYRVSLALVPSA